jgi:hypothetical protein
MESIRFAIISLAECTIYSDTSEYIGASRPQYQGTPMDNLASMSVFIRAADARSFTDAGTQLGVSSSAIGKTIARLEERLGVRLFHRSTRSTRNYVPAGLCGAKADRGGNARQGSLRIYGAHGPVSRPVAIEPLLVSQSESLR